MSNLKNTQRLVSMQQRRKGDAERMLAAANSAFAEAKIYMEQKQEELAQFRVEAKAREHKLYHELYGKTVTRDKLDEVRELVAEIHIQVVTLAQEALEAEQSYERAETDMHTARQIHLEVARRLEKFESIYEHERNIAQQEIERREEEAIEEVTAARACRREAA